MKKLYLLILFISTGLSSAWAGFFPAVDKPETPESSLIALQFSIDNKGELETFANLNWSMWTPIVKKEDGTIVEFRVNTGLVDMTTLYYKENLTPGKYTLIGFEHVYTDYAKLSKYELTHGKVFVTKNPYDDKPYRVKQFFPLEEPYEFTLKPGTMMTLGHYVIKYRYKEGPSGSSHDRYRVVEDRTKILMADIEDQHVLELMKPWATKKWKLWNKRNPLK